MFRGIQHRKPHALHAVAHRFGHLGFLIAQRIDTLLTFGSLVRIHIRLSCHGHDQLDNLAVLIDGGGQFNLLDITLESIGTERLEDDRIVILRTSDAVRAERH